MEWWSLLDQTRLSKAKTETWDFALGSLKKTTLYFYKESLKQIHYPFLTWILWWLSSTAVLLKKCFCGTHLWSQHSKGWSKIVGSSIWIWPKAVLGYIASSSIAWREWDYSTKAKPIRPSTSITILLVAKFTLSHFPDLYLFLILGVSLSNRIALNKNLNTLQFSNFKNIYMESLLKLMSYRQYWG